MTSPKTTPIRALNAVWDLDGQRREPGEEFPMTIPEAKALIAAGRAERADPMPGEG